MLLGTGDYDQRIVEQLSARSLVGDTNADANARLPMNASINLLSRGSSDEINRQVLKDAISSIIRTMTT